MRVLTGSDITITSPAFVDTDGYTPTDTDADPTVTVVSAAGQALTVSAVTDLTEAGLYTAVIQGLTNPDRLTAVWAGQVDGIDQANTDLVDVAGGTYATLPELVALDGINLAVHTPARLVQLRDQFEDLAERWTGRAWVPRFATETLWHPASPLTRRDARALLSVVDADDTTLATTGWTITAWGVVLDADLRSIGFHGQWPLTIGYTHGQARPPESLTAACRDYVRSKALETGNRIGKDTLSYADPQGGTTRYSTPDWNAGRPTGLLDVDTALNGIGRAEPLPS